MNVPVIEKRVGLETGGTTPQIKPITQAASGVNVSEAYADLGKTALGVSTQLAEHMLVKQKAEEEQVSNDRITAWSNDVHQNILGGDNGVLNRQGVNAKGAVELFDTESAKLADKYAKDLNPEQLAHFHANVNVHKAAMREPVISHESRELRKADEQGTAASIVTDSESIALNPESKESGLLYEDAKSKAIDLSHRLGESDDARKLRLQQVDDSIAEKIITLNPNKADYVLKNYNLSAKMRSVVEGAQLDTRLNSTWDSVKGYKNADGTSDLNKIMTKAEAISKSFPEDRQQKVISHIRTMANLQDAQLKDVRDANGRAFSNDAVTAYKQGMSYDQAHESIKKYAYDPTDFQNKEKILQGIYFKDSSAYDRMMEYWTPAQKREWDRIQAQAQKNFAFLSNDPDFKLYKEALLQEMFEGKASSPDAMQQVYLKSIDKQPTGEQRLWGLLSKTPFGEKHEIRGKLAIAVQENQQLVDAVGGIDKAIKIGHDLGGVEKLKRGTLESQAVIELSTRGYPVTKKNVDFVISKHPDWKEQTATEYDTNE